jgi:hypothetical protein
MYKIRTMVIKDYNEIINLRKTKQKIYFGKIMDIK